MGVPASMLIAVLLDTRRDHAHSPVPEQPPKSHAIVFEKCSLQKFRRAGEERQILAFIVVIPVVLNLSDSFALKTQMISFKFSAQRTK